MNAQRWLPLAAVALVAATLTVLNRGETVALDVGLTVLRRLPLSVVLLASFLLGMLAMALLSLRYDRRVRDVLARHGLLDELKDAPRAAAPRVPADAAAPPAPVAAASPFVEPAVDHTLAFPPPAEREPPASDVTILGPLPASDVTDPGFPPPPIDAPPRDEDDPALSLERWKRPDPSDQAN